jgi:hypothetical protein
MKMKGTKDNRSRKNPKQRDIFKELRAERNKERGKQTFDPATKTWSR